MASLIAACVVSNLRPDAGTVGITAIDKRPAIGAVKVGRLGLYADVQADRKNHGGADKAIYAYAQEDADFWSAELGRDLPPGWFGENLRVSGLDVTNARVGERWKIGASVEIEVTMPRSPCATFARWVGGADQRGWVKRFENLRVSGLDVTNARVGERWKIGATGSPGSFVEIEVTMPRSPCATFARWVGGADQRGWVKRFGAEGRLGAYLRVIRTGPVCAGDEIELLSAPADAPTILEMFRA